MLRLFTCNQFAFFSCIHYILVFQTVDASLMDPKTTTWLEQRLAELNVAVPPLLNVWATSVCRTDTLAEARSVIQELI